MLTVATWNLENLFRPGMGAGPTSQAAYDDKLSHLKATIGCESFGKSLRDLPPALLIVHAHTRLCPSRGNWLSP